MKNLRNLWKMSLKGLGASKMRSSLTVLSVAIGVAAVISLVSMGQGNQKSMLQSLESLGSNLLFVLPGATTEGGIKGTTGSAITLTMEDAQAIADSRDVIVAPEAKASIRASYKGKNIKTSVIGVTPEFEWVRNTPIKEGNFILPEDVKLQSTNCVLGNKAAQDLFGEAEEAMGKRIKLGDLYFKVVGILVSKGGGGLGYEDDSIFAPITTVIHKMYAVRAPRGERSISCISIKVPDRNEMDAEMNGITAFLHQRHGLTSSQENDFIIKSLKDMEDTVRGVSQSFTIFLAMIAMIALVVAGIGIMNIMMVSVTERTREIGILKSLGARRRDILTQFSLEALVLSIGGGGMGILIGCWGLPEALSGVVTLTGGQPMANLISLDTIMMAFTVAVTTGLIFGAYPALRAAKLNPIDALRHQ